MIRLSAFADEISPNPDEQVAVLAREGIHYLDLRSMWGINVLDLSDEQIRSIQDILKANHIQVAALGSPIGKVPIDSPFEAELQRLERAITIAQAYNTPYIRIFSYYPPSAPSAAGSDSNDPAPHRGEVMRRMRALSERARETGITLLHENEKDIYGDTIARCVDLMHELSDPQGSTRRHGAASASRLDLTHELSDMQGGNKHLQAAFDPANFIQCGQTPFPDAYEALRPWLAYVHVKDALPNGRVVAAGEGSARWPELLERLRSDGYDGFFSLEPHLAATGQFGGFTGPDLFHHAAQALKTLLQSMGWAYQ
jgi:3-dehydroshikimate dehydratase